MATPRATPGIAVMDLREIDFRLEQVFRPLDTWHPITFRYYFSHRSSVTTSEFRKGKKFETFVKFPLIELASLANKVDRSNPTFKRPLTFRLNA